MQVRDSGVEPADLDSGDESSISGRENATEGHTPSKRCRQIHPGGSGIRDGRVCKRTYLLNEPAAIHVLIPQFESGLRNIADQLGKPVTKPHAKIADVGVAVGMGDILYSTDVTEALGSDVTLYFLEPPILSDPIWLVPLAKSLDFLRDAQTNATIIRFGAIKESVCAL
jgi:hypothetical protein